MDSLKRRTTTEMIVQKPTQKKQVVKRNTLSEPVSISIQREAVGLASRSKNKSSKLVYILFVSAVALGVFFGIGYSYRRAEIRLTPDTLQYNTTLTFKVSKLPRQGAVHGIWVDSNSIAEKNNNKLDDVLLLNSSYTPLVRDTRTGKTVLLSTRDLERMIIAKKDDSSEKKIITSILPRDIKIDPIILYYHPDEFDVSAEFTVIERRDLDFEAIVTSCRQYNYTDPQFAACFKNAGIANIAIISHPWFLNHLPPKRALQVELVNAH